MAAIDLHQNLSQSQILSPQMRQSLEVLQANSLELGQILQQAIVTNPVLEIDQNDEQLDDFREADAEHDMETLSDLDDDFRELQITERRSTNDGIDDQEKRDHLYNSIVAPETLQQHLLSQLAHSEHPDKLKQVATVLIGYINDRGFMETSLQDIALSSDFTLEEAERAQVALQNFDPPGVAANDLQESLMIQLAKRDLLGSLEYRIVSEHLDAFARKRFPEIAKALGVNIDAIHEASHTIATLTPDPGAEFDPTSNPHITPDIIIYRDASHEWAIQLTNANIPDISISNAYKDLMTSTDDSSARQYLRDQIRDGKILIRSLSQRQDTLYKLAQQLILRQSDFLLQGMKALRPMTMNEVAEAIEVHPATISRAVAAKYIQTPHGLIELRSFFTSGYTTESGQQVSNTGIRDTIQKMIAEESPKKPLSDSAIEKTLKEQGVKIARRTIAKYRDQLGILPSHLRKSF
ncbi:RNA polymerase factor sigma-54 [Rubritalea marina]|uniref:RNA polymerase factor sigma-54 n=1 Tax=Rubritalea marina TaxID=361055 RepID=UPI000379BBA2|nr:RNA polymerase factor sigma-54 [Rubritalea marina]